MLRISNYVLSILALMIVLSAPVRAAADYDKDLQPWESRWTPEKTQKLEDREKAWDAMTPEERDLRRQEQRDKLNARPGSRGYRTPDSNRKKRTLAKENIEKKRVYDRMKQQGGPVDKGKSLNPTPYQNQMGKKGYPEDEASRKELTRQYNALRKRKAEKSERRNASGKQGQKHDISEKKVLPPTNFGKELENRLEKGADDGTRLNNIESEIDRQKLRKQMAIERKKLQQFYKNERSLNKKKRNLDMDDAPRSGQKSERLL
jgi:hypothetical protein